MAKATNDTSIFELTIADTNEHDLPDVNGDDTTGEPAYDVRGEDAIAAKVVNNQDQDATVRLEGTTFDDDGFAEPDEDVSGVTVTAGGGTETLKTDTPWSYVRVVVSFGTAPTGNNPTKVVFSSDKRGD